MRPKLLLLAALVSNAVRAGTPLSLDFETPLTHAAASAQPGSAQAATAPVGSIDSYLGKPGQALQLRVDLSGVPAATPARVALDTGPLRWDNREADLARLTLGVDLSPSVQQPVRLVLTSFDAAGRATGSRAATLNPPVAGAYFRHSLDLDRTEPLQGRFDATAPTIALRFELQDAPGLTLPRDQALTLAVDNLSISAPSYYVSPQGRDDADGRTPATAFATLQRANDAAGPGDMVLVMDGSYTASGLPDLSSATRAEVNAPVWRPWWVKTSGAVLTLDKAGEPARWIIWRAHPGHKPRLFNEAGWAAVKFDLGSAYIELRGFDIQGNAARLDLPGAQADSDITERNGWRYYGNPRYNGSGILADGRASTYPTRRPHHLRILDNRIHQHPAAGASLIGTDYVTLAGNKAFGNMLFSRWGSSGLSLLRSFNRDLSRRHKMFIVGNETYLNRAQVPWVLYASDAQGNPLPNDKAPRHQMSDGNGIIVDVSRRRDLPRDGDLDADYRGRTLVANNLSWGNGGAGIVMTTVLHVDVVHNTLYGNVQTPELAARGWGDLFLGGPAPSSGDIVVENNIVQSTVAKHALAIHPLTHPQPLLIRNNLFFGGSVQPSRWPQIANREADPRFVNPSLDPARADFRLRADSPARASGLRGHVAPLDDLQQRPRDPRRAPDLGALQADPQ